MCSCKVRLERGFLLCLQRLWLRLCSIGFVVLRLRVVRGVQMVLSPCAAALLVRGLCFVSGRSSTWTGGATPPQI